MKRIAVPSDDGTLIAPHFGRCELFIVFQIEEGRVTGKEMRANSQGGVNHGECHDSHTAHDHGSMGNLLRDCERVLCRGMGLRAAEALKTFGIEPLIVQTDLSAQDAVEAYLTGDLTATSGFCICQH